MENATRTEEIAERVRVELARRRMSGHELARRTGIDRMTMTRRLAAKYPFTVPELELVAEALDLTAVELLGES